MECINETREVILQSIIQCITKIKRGAGPYKGDDKATIPIK